MSKKTKIEAYVKGVSNNETYQKYLKEAAEFGYSLAEAKIKELKAELKAFKDMDLGEFSEISGNPWDTY